MTSEAVPVTPDETRGDIDDLDEFAYLLHVAHRELDSIPYTAPEVFVGRLRELIPLYSVLVAEVRALRDQRDKALVIHEAASSSYGIRLPDGLTICQHCNLAWPCPTVAALTGKDTE